VLGALLFSTVVAMGPAPGSIKRSGEAQQGQHQKGGPQGGATKDAHKPHAAEHEAYCQEAREGKERKDCIIALRSAEATERQAILSLIGLALVLVTIVLTALGLLLVKGTLEATRDALAEAKTSSGAAAPCGRSLPRGVMCAVCRRVAFGAVIPQGCN